MYRVKQFKTWACWVLGIVFLFTLIPTTAYAQGGQLDIVFAVDESGSMSNEQQAIKNNINVIVNQLNASGLDGRFGLVGFGASANGGAPHILTPITTTANFTAAVGNLVSSGGNEVGFQATSMAVSSAMDFRPGSGKCVVLVSDEDADPSAEPAHTTQKQQAIADLQATGAVFFGIVNGSHGTTQDDYGPNAGSLADVTSGTAFDIAAFVNDPAIVFNPLTTSCVVQALPAKICGMKFNDLDGNGVQDANEPGLPNWEIMARDGTNSISATTDSNGDYCIEAPAGTYTIAEIQQQPWVQTAPAAPGTYNVTVQTGQVVNNIDFGNSRPNVKVSGHKFWDLNGNGVQDHISQTVGISITEPLLDGFSFSLYSGDPNDASTWQYVDGPVTINNANDGYAFTNIPPGTYFIREDALSGWTQTAPMQNNGSHVFTVNSQHVSDLDFGNQICPAPCGEGYIMGFKFKDVNYNGMWDPNEADKRLAGVTIELLDGSGNVIQTTTTDSNGLYYFLGVAPGTYTVREQVPAGWIQTVPSANGGVHTVTISNTSNGVGLNFGNYQCDAQKGSNAAELSIDDMAIGGIELDTGSHPKGCVLGTKFNDENRNGVRDSGEGPLVGFDFRLQSTTNPADVYFVTSDAFGNFRFVVPPGTYVLSEIGELGWNLTTPTTNEYIVTVTGGGIASGFEFGNCTCGGSGHACGGQDISIYMAPLFSIQANENAEYSLEVANIGVNATAGPTTIHFSLPPNMELADDGGSEDGWSCHSEYARVQCVHQDSIPVGEATRIVLATALADGDFSAQVESCATVVVRDDLDLENNVACVESQVEDAPPEGPEERDPEETDECYTMGIGDINDGLDDGGTFGIGIIDDGQDESNTSCPADDTENVLVGTAAFTTKVYLPLINR